MSNTLKNITLAVSLGILANSAQAIDFNVDQTEVSIYGYARLNTSYDFNENLGNANGAGFDIIDSDGSQSEGHFDMSPAQSRLGFTTVTDLPVDQLKTNIEMDFLGSSNTLRLRHAYGVWNNILIGQTWANTTLFLGRTPTLDFPSHVGYPGHLDEARQAQIRYTLGSLSFSMEDPDSKVFSLNGTELSGSADSKETMPDLTMRYEGGSGRFKYGASALVNRFSVDDGSYSESSFGYGVSGALAVQVFPSTSIQGGFNYGEGIGAYLHRSGAPSGYISASSGLETVEGYGGTIGISHELTDKTSLHVSSGFAKVDYDDAVEEFGETALNNLDEKRSTTFVTYLWTPLPQIMFGAEYGIITVDRATGESADANRLMLSAQYSF